MTRKQSIRARRLEKFLTQPFATTEQFIGNEGRRVSLGRIIGRV